LVGVNWPSLTLKNIAVIVQWSADFILVFGQFRKLTASSLIRCSKKCGSVVENYFKVNFK